MSDWYERQIERWTSRFHFGLLTRVHPELSRIDDEKTRQWAIWYAATSETGWGRYASLFTLLVAGPVGVIVATRAVAHGFGWGYRVQSPLLIVGGWLAGFIVTAVLIELVRRKKARTRYFRAMRILGYDVCPACGYDMTGHEPEPTARTCPECGAFAPVLPVAARGTATTADAAAPSRAA